MTILCPMKVAYVTGGTKGIGLAVAQSLLSDGYHVAISGRGKESLSEAKALLASENLLCLQSNVKNREEEDKSIKQVIDTWGRLDVCIANAGVGHFQPIDELSDEQWHDTIDTNLTGVFNTVKACIPEIKSSKGYIITIASLAGTNFFARGAAYNASKFGLVGFSQAIMLDLRQYGIKVSTIMPGSVSTYFNNHVPSDADAWKIQPEDIGQMVIDLLHMNPRTLPSKVEVRPLMPPTKK